MKTEWTLVTLLQPLTVPGSIIPGATKQIDTEVYQVREKHVNGTERVIIQTRDFFLASLITSTIYMREFIDRVASAPLSEELQAAEELIKTRPYSYIDILQNYDEFIATARALRAEDLDRLIAKSTEVGK